MSENVILRDYGNLSIFCIGNEKCTPEHKYAWSFRDKYLLHYIISGRGAFECNGKSYNLEAGNAFLINRSDGVYCADKEEPWHYVWIKFSGDVAAEFLETIGLSEDTPIYKTSEPKKLASAFEELSSYKSTINDLRILGAVANTFSMMIDTSEKELNIKKSYADHCVDICCEYIKNNYYKKFKVSELVGQVMLEYSYIFRLFKKKLGISPEEYLIRYRLSKACRLLKDTQIPISEVARAVGYDNRIAFSKLFKDRHKMSPKEYRHLYS